RLSAHQAAQPQSLGLAIFFTASQPWVEAALPKVRPGLRYFARSGLRSLQLRAARFSRRTLMNPRVAWTWGSRRRSHSARASSYSTPGLRIDRQFERRRSRDRGRGANHRQDSWDPSSSPSTQEHTGFCSCERLLRCRLAPASGIWGGSARLTLLLKSFYTS